MTKSEIIGALAITSMAGENTKQTENTTENGNKSKPLLSEVQEK